ncbi:GH1 family beta-glucosidase [Treponema primitia]|uniref:GH1 family beta-glucosidase n=1 Tax=Treponema primitia TaxID=88058 RepID=UPI000255559F|nr:GH1 family beta-glucosidase [Treponema primitia]
MAEKYQFPNGFEWGTASASYQIEGAWDADGKGECIWDRFSHTPGHIHDGTTGDRACDFYHRYEDDIRLAKKLGIKVYRFSISWPRIFPDGTGAVNEAGIAFYRKVLTCLHDNGIKAGVTMYHWDLPQKLQDRGGWANREIVGWFETYAKTLYERLGDLVDYWITLNEPYCTSIIGYWIGEHAPGYHDYSMALSAVHHLLLAHGAAVKAYRKTGLKADIGITLNMNISYPYNPDCPEDVAAAKRNQEHSNNLFGDPIFLGKYPEELFSYLKKRGVVLPDIQTGDMELISQKVDFFGLNTYFTDHVKADETAWPLGTASGKTGRPQTDMGWEVNPEGMYDLLKWIHSRYNPPKVIITENGAATNDWVNVEGKVDDPNRIDYLYRYLAQVHKAIQEGVPVQGYYVWCFCDNFEWAKGLSKRFGIVYVDYDTQKRTPKESAYWYAELIKNNGY